MVRAVTAKAASIVRRKDLAAEIAHDTFIKLWQGGGQFPNERAVYVWLYKTCHRAAIDHLRSAAHRREDYKGDDEAIAASAGSTGGGDAVMTRQLIEQSIARLKPEEAEAFLYATLDGMTQEEVAEVMGLSRRTVQRLLARVDERFEEVRRDAR
jgi:RNA polymerase sigma-70 factor (ECF subfamily)